MAKAITASAFANVLRLARTVANTSFSFLRVSTKATTASSGNITIFPNRSSPTRPAGRELQPMPEHGRQLAGEPGHDDDTGERHDGATQIPLTAMISVAMRSAAIR